MQTAERFTQMVAEKWEAEIERAMRTAKTGRTENDEWFHATGSTGGY